MRISYLCHMSLISRLNRHPLLRAAVLFACGLVVFVFVVTIVLSIFTRHGQRKAVPDFAGMPLARAEQMALEAHLRLEVNDSLFVPAYEGGVVLDQNPAPGDHVKADRRIFVVVNAFHQRKVDIPYVTGYSLRQAKNTLEVAGLQIDKLVYRPDLATNYVLEERYQGRLISRTSREQAEVGSGITLFVGMGEGAVVAVPKVIGFPLKEAKSRLWEVGLNVGEVIMDEGVTPMNIAEARVYAQSPDEGLAATLGRSVTLRITLDLRKLE